METERRMIDPAAGFSRELGFYLGALEDGRNRLKKIASDLTADELTRRAFPEAHQTGNLILHIGEAEAYWIQAIVAGRELSEEEKKFVHWDDTTERDFAEKNYSAPECLERIDRISEMSREILKGVADSDLDQTSGYERDGKRVEVSLRWVLHHLLDHQSVHRGQISMLKRMLRGE